MLIKLLGLIDLGVALMIALAELGVPIGRIYIFLMLAHAIKATLFIKDVLSLVDLVIVLYTFVFLFWSNPIISLIIIIFLTLKGIYSFV